MWREVPLDLKVTEEERKNSKRGRINIGMPV